MSLHAVSHSDLSHSHSRSSCAVLLGLAFGVCLCLCYVAVHSQLFSPFSRRWGHERANELRAEFVVAMPDTHKQFLRELEWVVDLEVGPGILVCLHAGLHLSIPAEHQIRLLKTARDCSPDLMTQKV